MRTLPLGRSATHVTELSLGAAPLGNLFTAISDEQARGTVDAAWDSGVRSFDTAPHYGLGLSERRLGSALRERPRDEYVLSTKVGRLLRPTTEPGGDDLAQGFAVPAEFERVWDFSADGVRRSIEASLTRLGLDRIDIVYLHDPDDHEEQAFGSAYPELERLRAEGTVGAIGAGMNQTRMLDRFVRETDMDVVLLAGRYSLLDQTGLDVLLPDAARRGISVIVGGVFNSGLLADPKPGATFDYAPASTELLNRALRLKALCTDFDVPLRAAALQFPLGHPAVAGVLVGARSAAEALDAALMTSTEIPAELWSVLREEGLLPSDAPLPAPAGERGAS
ncbi:aldo/keto reductase [Streptacidiphilus jiangxiensis]|uniref:D-threo-aldose 1-dehydrogenase n=1 Tax=Streptacidiphilus jiangxiensis TaxID=235985 RepID=A0A1H7WCJ9_STRJI|nr:aldo/keto reductase [Streptacidiphilus jiangxiensis]SEM19296.1 D-threo-aldose 1-dehydrogenase [Streptacidiphilus jiangxiensis]